MTKQKKRGKIKILIFDCWLPGYTYVEDLKEKFSSVSVIFIHTSSLQMGSPAREYKAFKARFNIPDWVHDFSEFGYNFERLFKEVGPDAVLILSLHHLESRTAAYFAKNYNIPTCFIPHGIFFIGKSPYFISSADNNIRKILYAFLKIQRALYYTRFFWKFHFQAIAVGVRKLQLITAAISYFKMMTRYFYWQWWPSKITQKYYKNIIDYMILYDSFIESHYKNEYGAMVEKSKFIRSGTLDLGRISRYFSKYRAENSDNVSLKGRYAYHISSPSPKWFYSEESISIYGDIVGNLRNFVLLAGYDDLIYRPHPGEPDDFTRKVCALAGVQLDLDRSIANLATASVVCGTSSSLMYSAVILNKPIVIVQSQRLEMFAPYYEPLLSYPTIPFDADGKGDAAALDALKSSRMEDRQIDISQIRDPFADLVDLVTQQPNRGNARLAR